MGQQLLPAALTSAAKHGHEVRKARAGGLQVSKTITVAWHCTSIKRSKRAGFVAATRATPGVAAGRLTNPNAPVQRFLQPKAAPNPTKPAPRRSKLAGSGALVGGPDVPLPLAKPVARALFVALAGDVVTKI